MDHIGLKWLTYGRVVACDMLSYEATETVMRTTRLALLAGAAAIILAGYAPVARARTPETHVLTLRLPDGQTEQVRYVGDVPPTVILAPDVMAPETADPFTQLQRISARMDRQAEALFNDFAALGAAQDAGFVAVPALSGPGVRMHSVQITYDGSGSAPHVVSHTAGDCGASGDQAAPAAVPGAPQARPGPRVIEAKAPIPRRGLLRMVSDWQP